MPLMTYNAEVIRGWPNDGARDNYETLDTGVTVSAGDWVISKTGNVVTNIAAGGVGVGAGNGVNAGLVARGNGDSASASSSNKATVIWGNAIVRVATSTLAAAYASPAVRDKVTLRATGNGAAYKIDLAATTDQVVGWVKEVNAAVANQTTANIVVVLF